MFTFLERVNKMGYRVYKVNFPKEILHSIPADKTKVKLLLTLKQKKKGVHWHKEEEKGVKKQ